MDQTKGQKDGVVTQVPGFCTQIHLLVGPGSTATTCMFCQESINTAVKYSDNSRTHIAGALWCLACCMCCVPYCVKSSKNSDHYCPNCHKYLGTYQK